MTVQLRSIMTVLALVCTCKMAGAVDIYVLTNNLDYGSTTTDFGRVDSTTGAYTSIASLSGDIRNLTWNPTTGTFFATSGILGATTLRTITTTGTISASLGTIGRTIYGMAYRTLDSSIYAFDYDNMYTGTISTSNGAWSNLNTNTGLVVNIPNGGRYTIMNDTLYFSADDSNAFNTGGAFGTIGYTASSAFQLVKDQSEFAYMNLANDGNTLYGLLGNFNAQQLYTVNPNTGVPNAGPLISGTGLGTYFHGASTTVVPEPSTYALTTIATGVMAAVARRRKARRA